MPRTRLHIAAGLSVSSTLQLDADKARYLSRVLRLHVGDTVSVFDGSGAEYAATISAISKSEATLSVGEEIETRSESTLRVHLVQGISRGERMDFVVQKATELGVKRITPVLTDYGVVKLDDRRAARRREHWEGVAVSACEQSGRTRLPLIDTPLPLRRWFGAKPADTDVDLILAPGASTPLAELTPPRTKVCILVGPEGGFSHTEYDDAEIAGFEAVSLGPRILRTETAAAAALAVMQATWGDLRNVRPAATREPA